MTDQSESDPMKMTTAGLEDGDLRERGMLIDES
jgi:hypothetical protein